VTPTRICATCAHWKPASKPVVGECCRYPPQVTEANRNGDWPGTAPDDWCGEWATAIDPASPRQD
jgi:hypothetical protein